MVEDDPPVLDLKEWNTRTSATSISFHHLSTLWVADLLWRNLFWLIFPTTYFSESNETEWTKQQVANWYEEHQQFEGGPLDAFVDGFDDVPEDFTASEEEVRGFTS